MILSVLIPTYNYDCTQLVRQLLHQLPEDGEIILGDDCSTDADVVLRNSEIAKLQRCRVLRTDRNLGRAGIRNALAKEAKGEWLLFVDADAEVLNPSYIANYLVETELADVVCGGTGNLPQCPFPGALLRYEYEVKAEKRLTLQFRQSQPYSGFTTFNFLIRRSLFLSIGFDESIKAYGHEDTQFGLGLKKRGIMVRHIDNKLIHLGLEAAEVYLAKTETALQTLSALDIQQQESVRVSAMALHLKRLYLLGLVRLLFKISQPLLRRNLLGKHPSQLLFAFYKLGFYSTQKA